MKTRTKIILAAIGPLIGLVGAIAVAVINKWGDPPDESTSGQPITEISVNDVKQDIQAEDCNIAVVITDKKNINVKIDKVDQKIECKKGEVTTVEQDSQAPIKDD